MPSSKTAFPASAPGPTVRQLSMERPGVGPRQQLECIAAGVSLILLTLTYQLPDRLITHPYGSFATELVSMRALFRVYVVLLGGLLPSWLLQPTIASLLSSFRARMSTPAHHIAAVLSIMAACLLLSIFLVFCGRHQFGAWDFSILIDTGWRQIIGQRPYVDFVAPTPPFFNWGSALAFQLFGVTWNANLYLAALFCCLTLLWSYALLRQLGMHAASALGTSVLMQCAAMLTCCFWWYNNTTLILAALFFLTSMLLVCRPDSRLAQSSFVLLGAVLPLTKPNIAGITLAGCLVLLFICSKARGRILLLCLAAGIVCLLFAGTVLHLSWSAMLETYRGIAKERGGASAFGFQSLTPGERRMTVLWMLLLGLPLLSILRPLRHELRSSQWRRAAFWLFFPLSALVAAYGIASNGEWRDVECTLLIAALSLLAFVLRRDSPNLRRFVVALMCGMASTDLYVGAARLRVFTVGIHRFFEWSDNERPAGPGFFRDVRGSTTLAETDREMTEAISHAPGPVFLGQRLEFGYAAFQLTSPLHWPTFFQPGTSFDRSQTGLLLRNWQVHRFQTLIFLKDEYVFYPDQFMDELDTHYVRDDRFPMLSVYHRRPGA